MGMTFCYRTNSIRDLNECDFPPLYLLIGDTFKLITLKPKSDEDITEKGNYRPIS